MITIIKRGNKKYQFLFSCKDCFCKFKADEDDCEMLIYQAGCKDTSEKTAVCRCPECNAYCIGFVNNDLEN